MKRYSISLFAIGFVLVSFGFWLNFSTGYVIAQDDPAQVSGGNFCTMCHNENTSAIYTLADNTTITVDVDTTVLANSVHGDSNPDGALSCTDCHGEDAFPHDDLPAANLREYTITKSNMCIDCHTEQAENLADDVHYTGLVNGNLRAATCVDCHGSHDVQPLAENPPEISETCGDCHQIVFRQYASSVHGEALFNGDTNVPTCVSCHGVHGIQHPTTALFRNRSPELCADCHADEELMAQYDITTNVFDSYLTDFHGTTVQLFDQSDPNVPSNKAVCYDCHGVHDILPADDENSNVIRDNLLTTCRECHPDATSDFPDSWVGHYPPTFASHPFLTSVNLFYWILIPSVIGVFILLVLTDIIRMIRQRLRGR
jgi:predicted CXXCH cytochrome family protein